MSILGWTARALAAVARGAIPATAAIIRRGWRGIRGTNWVRKVFGPLTPPESGKIYQTANDSIVAGALQGSLGPRGIVNPADVPRIPPGGVPAGREGMIDYDVRIPLIERGKSEPHWVTVHVLSPAWLNLGQIVQEALASSLESVRDSEPASSSARYTNPPWTDVEIAAVVDWR